MDTKGNNNTNNLLNINEYRLNKVIGNGKSIREFGDRYEYCIIDEYEKKYDVFTCDSIEIAGIYVQILTVKGDHKLVSIDFPKDVFEDIEDIPNYLDFYSIKLLKDGRDTIYNACDYWTGLKFRGTAIVVYEKGSDTIPIDLDELVEVTEVYDKHKYRINTSSSKVRKSIISESKIFLDNVELDFIPEIEIEIEKDLVIANGHIILAGYIGSYKGHIAFFENKNDDLPMSWIHDNETTVFIDVYHPDERKIIVVEHNYAIDFKDFN